MPSIKDVIKTDRWSMDSSAIELHSCDIYFTQCSKLPKDS